MALCFARTCDALGTARCRVIRDVLQYIAALD
jgi:hypothetical protein